MDGSVAQEAGATPQPPWSGRSEPWLPGAPASPGTPLGRRALQPRPAPDQRPCTGGPAVRVATSFQVILMEAVARVCTITRFPTEKEHLVGVIEITGLLSLAKRRSPYLGQSLTLS